MKTEKELKATHAEVAVLLRRPAGKGAGAEMERESVYGPTDCSPLDPTLAEIIGQSIAEAPGYAMVFMSQTAPFGLERDAFIHRVERAARMQAGVGFALVFPVV